MDMNYKYTTDGRKVVVIGSLNSQEKIVQEVFVSNGSELPAGEHFVVKTLLDAPAVSWKEERVKEMEAAYERMTKLDDDRQRQLRAQREKIEAHLEYAGKALKGISPDSFKLLCAFLTGRVKWIVRLGYNREIIKWDTGTCDRQLRLVSLFGRDDGTLMYRHSQYYDGSDHKSGDEFIPFENYEEAKAKWAELYRADISDQTLKVAAEHGIELDQKAVSEFKAKRIEGIQKEVDRCNERIAEYQQQIEGLTPALGARSVATKERVPAKRNRPKGARRGPTASRRNAQKH